MRGRRRRRNLPSSSSSSSSTSGSKKLECSSRVYKKRAKKEEHENVEEDIISNLPQDILHHIFTFLEMKQTIQTTCLLSKRWRHFWVSIPTLKFTYMGGKGYRTKANRNEFMDFVDRVLMIRDNNSNLHEFVLVNLNDVNVTDRLNTWIITSVIRNVQKLTLTSHFPQKSQLHRSLFTCKSLTKLVVEVSSGRLSLSLPDSITLPSLKTLSLHSVMFEGDENVMDHLFSSCPVLESLIMKSCVFPHDNINIPSPQLQHLVLQYCRTRKRLLREDPSDIKFKLCVPNLITFHYVDCMSTCCDLKNVCSLVKADINVYGRYEWSKEKKAMYAPHMVNILRELHNAEDLTISTLFLEVITGAPDLLDSQPTKFCNLKCLKLKGTCSQGWIPAISYLLKISPNIETLCIDVDLPENPATDLLDVQPTYFCNLRCLKMHTLFSRDCIYAIACLLKICPNTETLSLYHEKDCDEIMNPYCDEINSDRVIKKDYWKTVLSLECLLNHLKCFELRDVMGRINELEFLEILLKNAMVLDKVLIVFKTTYSDTSGRQIKFSEKVLTFPRASPSVVILFKFSEKVL